MVSQRYVDLSAAYIDISFTFDSSVPFLFPRSTPLRAVRRGSAGFSSSGKLAELPA